MIKHIYPKSVQACLDELQRLHDQLAVQALARINGRLPHDREIQRARLWYKQRSDELLRLRLRIISQSMPITVLTDD